MVDLQVFVFKIIIENYCAPTGTGILRSSAHNGASRFGARTVLNRIQSLLEIDHACIGCPLGPQRFIGRNGPVHHRDHLLHQVTR
jgi:hypothetical protein